MPSIAPAFFRLLLLTGMALMLTGCVTSKKYKMAKKEGMPPARMFDWQASASSADLTLHSVIVFKGPGSWKREARWDEYTVTVANRGSAPLVVGEAVLIDLLGQPQVSGVEPWKLEKLSYTNWDKYGKTGLKLLAGAGAVTLYGAAVVATSLGSIMGGGAAAGGGVAILNIIPVVALVDITAVAIMNNQNKKKVVAEFNRRRLALPLTIPGGQSVTGSFFFPMTPGPRKMFLRGGRGDQPVELALDLAPLAGLHIKPGAQKKTTPP